MGPSREEVVAAAADLIARHGSEAGDEARHLAEVAVRLRYPRNRDLYWRAAREIEKRLSVQALTAIGHRVGEIAE